jgi:predicted RNase H-like HicB family nuclease
MPYPMFIYRGFVAVARCEKLANGKIDGNFAIYSDNPECDAVHQTERMAECDTRAEAIENMTIVAEAWIEERLDGKKP